MQTNSTPITAFHNVVRATLGLDSDDHGAYTSYKITEKIKSVVKLGSVPGYRISSDGGSIEPALTPESDQASYTLLVYETVLAFSEIPKHLRDDLDQKIYELKNGDGGG